MLILKCKNRFQLLSNLFAVVVESSPSHIQTELIKLQCRDTLKKAKCDSVGVAEFARFILNTMPQLCIQDTQMLLSMSGSTYLCKQQFSLMKLNKTPHTCRLTDECLHSIRCHELVKNNALKPSLMTH